MEDDKVCCPPCLADGDNLPWDERYLSGVVVCGDHGFFAMDFELNDVFVLEDERLYFFCRVVEGKAHASCE